MEALVYHSLNSSQYIGIITILDYELRIRKSLSQLSFHAEEDHTKKVLVDLALKTGFDKYRFVAFDLNRDGRIELDSNRYVNVSKNIEYSANQYLLEKNEIVMNSILTNSDIRKLMNVQ